MSSFIRSGLALALLHTQVIGGAALEDESRFLSGTRQLTFEGRRSGEGYFAPDGQALIFQSEREPGNPFYQIYVMDLESGERNRVSPGRGKTTCAFFRPGTDEVLFSSTHHDPEVEAKTQAEIEFRASGKERRYSWDYDARMDVFCARRDGSALRRLTDAPGYDAEAAYSPDGKWIVFCSLREAYPVEKLSSEERKLLENDPAHFGELYIMRADGSGQRRLTRTPGYDGGPFFSADGERIVWRRFEEGGLEADIYTMRTDGSDVRRLTRFGSMSWAPYFHPSGEYVIFASNKLGFSNFELFLVDARGKREPVRVTTTDGFDGLPVFSPDGRGLCWTSTRTSGGNAQLFLARWSHENALAALELGEGQDPPAGSVEPEPGTSEAAAGVAEFSPEIRVGDLRSLVDYLASDDLEGRMAGSEGARRASEYIAERLREAGVEPMGDDAGWFQEYRFKADARVVPAENSMTIRRDGKDAVELTLGEDFRPLAFTSRGEVEGELVFAGYGLSVPGEEGAGYNSYAGLDVDGKIVLVLRYVPEDVTSERRQELNRYAGLRYKAMIAREEGAKAVLFVTGPNSPGAGELAGLNFERGVAGSDIVAASISGEAARVLLGGSGRDLQALQSGLDKEDPHAESGFGVPAVQLKIATSVEYVLGDDRNVLGGFPPAGEEEEYVVIGAHYDHIGRGGESSLSGKAAGAEVHNGADDNASGTAAVLELAAAFARERDDYPEAFRRGVIFALWGGEEIGLTGSSRFVKEPPVPLESIVAYVNFDMVGRLKDNRLMLQGVGSSPLWRKLAERRNVRAGFQLVLQEDPYLPTDVTSFYPKEVPVLNFFTGSHEDYHRPTDTPEKLDYRGLDRVTRLARGIILDLVRTPEPPEYSRVKRSDSGGGARERLRVYLGTIPDYTGEVEGVKLTGVREGGPADRGGLRGEDIIVEFGGQKIANIYDYTYALDAAKIGEPLEVVVLRDGKRVELTVVPEARK